MKQVLVRKKMLHGNMSIMRRATVLEEKRGGRLRIQVGGKTEEIMASECIPVASVSGGQPVASNTRELLIPKMYPGEHSLMRRLG